MADVIHASFGSKPREVANNPIYRAIDELASVETENMRWLREVAPIARRLNEESRDDPGPEAA